MIELHHVGFGIAALLGGLHIMALRRRAKELRRRRVILDMAAVNSPSHLRMAALTNQAHRDGDPEF